MDNHISIIKIIIFLNKIFLNNKFNFLYLALMTYQKKIVNNLVIFLIFIDEFNLN